jgi:hypothetical protein
MPLTLPTLDDRDYNAILAEALARIPVHNPEWTNFNDSDPGVTLLQLFAFMTDSLQYRANLIPERNRRKFLDLLGIPLRPAAAAVGVATLANARGPRETVTLPRGLSLSAGSIGFVSDGGLDVLPVEGQLYYREPLGPGEDRDRAEQLYAQLYGAGEDGEDPATLDFYRTLAFHPPVPGGRIGAVDLRTDTVDGSLWLALLVRAADGTDPDVVEDVARSIGGKTLTLGLAPAWDTMAKVLRPGGSNGGDHALRFDVSTGAFDGALPRYRALPTAADGDPLEELTLVQLTLPEYGDFGVWDGLDPIEEGVGELPPALEDDAVAGRVLCWIRIRVGETAAEAGWAARFSWVGINAVRIAQRMPVPPQRVGTGTGEPDQVVSLANTPVIPDTVALTVDGEAWARTDDLLAAPAEVPAGEASEATTAEAEDPRVYAVDREAGTIRFGTGLAGARPRSGASIVASYSYGGGRAGNVGVGAVRTAPNLPAGFKATNPLPTWGGDDGETVAEAERRIPLQLKHNDRAVSAEDFRDIVEETPGIALGRVEVLSTWHPDIGGPAPGVVTLVLVPDDPQRPEGPVPDRLFLQAVCRHLEPRRLVTTEVHLRGPEYVPLSVSVGFEAVAGVEIALVREAITAALKTFLSPLEGGQEETGWPLDKPVEDRELWARVARVDGVASVRGVRVFDDADAEVATLLISGLELPRLDRVAVRTGDPEDLSVGATPTPSTTGATGRRVPVPVVPASC